ncbi:MAG: hypothetical protein M3253_01805 [Chloroflexota bacterium]|nr:hypothetical protein [Chloroflexota bacterium]
MSSKGPAAEQARAEVREIIAHRGHAVDNARDMRDRLRRAFADGALVETEGLRLALADLEVALEQEEGQKLGGKSAEASRFILRAIDRLIDQA